MLPPEYRDIVSAASGSGGFMLAVFTKCIVAYPMPEWQPLKEQIQQLPNLKEDLRDFRSMIAGRSEELELDPQGRMRISQSLIRYAGLSKDVLLVGMGNRFEIWDRQRFEGLRLDDAAFDRVVQELAQRGIHFSL